MNVVGDSDDEKISANYLLTNIQVLMLWNAFENVSSANMKLSKKWLHKRGQSRGLLIRLWDYY